MSEGHENGGTLPSGIGKDETTKDENMKGTKPEEPQGKHVRLLPFSILYGMSALFTTSLYYSVISQVTVIEKVFGLSSQRSGLLITAFDIGYLSLILFSSHFLQRFHIPRTLAAVSFVCGLVGSLACLPHFIYKTSMETDHLAGSNGSTASSLASICIPRELNGSSANTSCHGYANGHNPADKGRSVLAFAIIFVCTMIPGICASPRLPLVATYIDSNIERLKSGPYIGLVNSFGIFGAVVAIGLGGVFNKIPVDLKETSLTPEDPRWLGAWWLPFPVFGIGCIILSIPIAFFPRGRNPAGDRDPDVKGVSLAPPLLQQIKDLPKSLLRILCRPVYVLFVLSMLCNMFGMMSVASFGPKYLETQFDIPTWKANIIISLSNLVTTVVGTLGGGILTRRLRLELPGLVTLVFVVQVLTNGISALQFWFGCQNQDIVGFDTGRRDLVPAFNTTCDCTGTPFLPVCIDGTSTYYSPCHAGCQVQTPAGYSQCLLSSVGGVKPGLCDTDCPYLIPLIGATVVLSLIGCIQIAPFYMILLRTVDEKDRSLAMGLQAFLQSLCVLLPAPIFYGKLIDNTCKIWSSTCGVQGACALYDIVSMRITLVAIQLGLCVVGSLITGAALVYARKTFVPAVTPKLLVNDTEKELKN